MEKTWRKQFGVLFKIWRMELGLTLREFCRTHELDPGYISRIERGLLSPPTRNPKTLVGFAKMLHLKKDSDDWQLFLDAGMICAGQIPDDIMADRELVKRLFFIFHDMRRTKKKSRK